MKNYIVTTGIFTGTIFNGTPNNNRITNNDTIGQSFPAENCEPIKTEIPEKETIKTLADFKRLLQIGTNVHCVFHQAFNGRDENKNLIYKDEDKGIRAVSIKQTNSFALKTTKDEPIAAKGMYKDENGVNHFNEFETKTVDSWCVYPKASECIIRDNSVTILQENRRYTDLQGNFKMEMVPVLTYSILKN